MAAPQNRPNRGGSESASPKVFDKALDEYNNTVELVKIHPFTKKIMMGYSVIEFVLLVFVLFGWYEFDETRSNVDTIVSSVIIFYPVLMLKDLIQLRAGKVRDERY